MRAALLPACAGLCLLAQPAAAQALDSGLAGAVPVGGALPSLGTGTAVNDLRPQLERYFEQSTLPATAPTFLLSPSLGVDLGITDNANRDNGTQNGGGKSADVFTVITPTIQVAQDSARIKSNLSYSPTIQIYARNSNQSQFANYFNGQSLATLVRDALYLDLRGAISQTSLLGSGFNNNTGSTFSNQNRVQTTTFSITPYAEHRFGGWGTARLGYSFVRTLQDSNNYIADNNVSVDVFGNPVNRSQGYGSLGNLTTQRERASFASGENLGRFNSLSVLEAIQYAGSGYSGSHRNQALEELGYALTRRVTLLGGIGYQDILYTGNSFNGINSSAVRVNEPTWNVGFRYTPNADSTITVTYGRRDGSASVTLDGQAAPTARTRVFARYSTGITSDLEDAQNLLDTTSVGAGGLVTDSVTGAPVSSGNGFGLQNGIYRVRRGSLNGLLLASRDSYSVAASIEDRTTLNTTSTYYTGAVIPSGTSTSSYSFSGGWQHELAPDMSSNLTLQYASSNNSSQLLGLGNSRQDTVSVLGSVSKRFTETLSGSARYIHNERIGGNNAQVLRAYNNNYSENTFLVGLRKSF